MGKNVGNHMHRSAASSAKPFPGTAESVQEIVRGVRESRLQRVATQRRDSPRLDVDDLTGVLTAIHPGGSLAAAECVVVDLSASGAGLL